MDPRSRVSATCVMALAVAVAVGVTTPQVAAAPSARERARVATRYLASQQRADGSLPGFSPVGSTADAVVSMVAAKRGPRQIDRAIVYLRTHIEDADSIGLKAKVAAAVTVAGRNPRRFGGHNLIGEIEASQLPDGRYGAGTPVLHHALAMIAVATAGGEPSGPERDWLVAAQCPDGGWQFDEPWQPSDDDHCSSGEADFFGSETDATAYAVIALAGFERWEQGDEKDPFAFFLSRRDPVKNGWGYDAHFPLTNANSTALVIEAFRDHPYRDLPAGAVRALTRLQRRLCGKNAGAFAYSYEERDDGTFRKTDPDVGATIGAILGLRSRPFDQVAVTKAPPRVTKC